jgi:hypothetical protein
VGRYLVWLDDIGVEVVLVFIEYLASDVFTVGEKD